MNTKIFELDTKNIDDAAISELGGIILNGGLVSFPTETVYGLGANAFLPDACANIFKAKGRPSDNPLIVHISTPEALNDLAVDVSEKAMMLFERFSPGPLTVILKKSDRVPEIVTAGLDTVAIRIPSHPIARALIEKSGVPIAAPSSNLSGKPSPTCAHHVIHDMMGRVDAIIDGGPCVVGLESTIVDMSGDVPVLLRPGGITYDDLKVVVPDIQIDSHVLKSLQVDETPKCPGMKYKHYAPDAEVFVVEGEKNAVEKKIKELIDENKDKKIGVISMNNSAYNASLVLNAGDNNITYANKLFYYLREFDNHGIDIVFAEMSCDDAHALAVKNRLYKSAANRIIRV